VAYTPALPAWPVTRLVVAFVAFEAAWFAAVIGAARGWPVWGMAAVAASIVLQLAGSDRRRADLGLIGVAALVGLVWDSLLVGSGTVRYASPGPLTGLAPAWIVLLWAQLGAVLREPLRWLHRRPGLAAALGAAGGAASYAGAARLGACSFDDPLRAGLVLAAGWAVLLPLLLALARRLDKPAR
jgi:hypothetical protein